MTGNGVYLTEKPSCPNGTETIWGWLCLDIDVQRLLHWLGTPSSWPEKQNGGHQEAIWYLGHPDPNDTAVYAIYQNGYDGQFDRLRQKTGKLRFTLGVFNRYKGYPFTEDFWQAFANSFNFPSARNNDPSQELE